MLKKQNKIRYQKVKQNLFISGPRKHPVMYAAPYDSTAHVKPNEINIASLFFSVVTMETSTQYFRTKL